MTLIHKAVEDLVSIATEIRYFSQNNNHEFLNSEILQSWAEDIIYIAENEIGYD